MILIMSILAANPGPPSAVKIGFSVIGGGVSSSAKSETLCLCRNEKQLKKALSDMGIMEEVQWPGDLGKGVVIIAFLGQRRTGGYGLDPAGIYMVNYKASHSGWKAMWDYAITPLLEQDGIDPAAVPSAPIEKVRDAVVIIKETCPPKDAIFIQIITSPYVILAVPNHNLNRVHGRFVRCTQ